MDNRPNLACGLKFMSSYSDRRKLIKENETNKQEEKLSDSLKMLLIPSVTDTTYHYYSKKKKEALRGEMKRGFYGNRKFTFNGSTTK
jgi:hypothetical protein